MHHAREEFHTNFIRKGGWILRGVKCQFLRCGLCMQKYM